MGGRVKHNKSQWITLKHPNCGWKPDTDDLPSMRKVGWVGLSICFGRIPYRAMGDFLLWQVFWGSFSPKDPVDSEQLRRRGGIPEELRHLVNGCPWMAWLPRRLLSFLKWPLFRGHSFVFVLIPCNSVLTNMARPARWRKTTSPSRGGDGRMAGGALKSKMAMGSKWRQECRCVST